MKTILKTIAGAFYVAGVIGLVLAVRGDPVLWTQIGQAWLVQVAPWSVGLVLAYVMVKHLINPIGREFARVRGF